MSYHLKFTNIKNLSDIKFENFPTVVYLFDPSCNFSFRFFRKLQYYTFDREYIFHYLFLDDDNQHYIDELEILLLPAFLKIDEDKKILLKNIKYFTNNELENFCNITNLNLIRKDEEFYTFNEETNDFEFSSSYF